MKLVAVLLMTVCAAVCSAQQPYSVGVIQNKIEVKPLKCGKGFEWYDDGVNLNEDGTTGQCVKWKHNPESDGRKCYICESGHCGGCVKHTPPPQALKCEKYEHEVKWKECTGNWISDFPNPPADYCPEKNTVYKFKCAPDEHTVTEREWQELMQRLKKLEADPKIKLGPAEKMDCSKDPNQALLGRQMTDYFPILRWLNWVELMRALPNQRMTCERKAPVSKEQSQNHCQTEQSKDHLRNPLHRLGQMGENQSEYPVEHCENQEQNQKGNHQVQHLGRTSA